MRVRGWVVAAAALLAVLLPAGCASAVVPGAGAPARDAPVADLPFDAAARLAAEQAAVLRTRDVCAVHDLAVAERATGAVALVVRPRGGFDGCEVVLAAGPALSYLSVEVGPVVPGGGPPAAVTGRVFPRVAPAEDARGRAECGYARPDGLGTGFVVRGEVLADDGTGDPAASCRLAAAYLEALLPRLDAPPVRAAAGTDPAFALAGQDPCALLALAVPGAADPAVDGSRACTGGGTTVTVDLVRVEADVPGAATLLAGGRVEAVAEADGACTVTRQASDAVLLAPSLPYLHREVVAVAAPDCGTARGHLDRIGPAVGPPAVPAPGALRLGALDAGPSATEAGAPFDPCTTVGWADFPPGVRPPGVDPRPFPSPAGTAFPVGCDYTSDAVAAVVSWAPGGPAAGAPAEFAGRAGREDRREGACTSALDLAAGTATVATVARDPEADPCAVNRAVLEALAPRTG